MCSLQCLTFYGGGQGRCAGLRVAQEHLLVQAAQGVVGRVGVLLHKHVARGDDVHHDHFHRHAIGKQELQKQEANRRHVRGFTLTHEADYKITLTSKAEDVLTQEVMGSEGSVRGMGGGA